MIVILFTVFIKKKYWFDLSQTDGEEFKIDNLPNYNINQALENLQIKKIESDYKTVDF